MACCHTVLTTSGQVASNSAKHSGSLEGTETTRYLLLDLRHPDIIFTQVVGEWNLFIIHESEHVLLDIRGHQEDIRGHQGRP